VPVGLKWRMTYLLASSGECQSIGDKMKKKHEVNIGSSRVSITMLRTGSAAGETGSTTFLPAGTRRKTEFTDEYLVQNSALQGSSIAMTETGYMTRIVMFANTRPRFFSFSFWPRFFSSYAQRHGWAAAFNEA
jgi:hypothetical protein